MLVPRRVQPVDGILTVSSPEQNLLKTRNIDFIIVTGTKGNGWPTRIIVRISIGFPISPPFVSSISP